MFIKAYLFVYNTISTALWYAILSKITLALVETLEYKNIYPQVFEQVMFVQTLALLEIIHAALGLVKSKVITNVVQIGSRLAVVWIICHFLGSKVVHESVAYLLVFFVRLFQMC